MNEIYKDIDKRIKNISSKPFSIKKFKLKKKKNRTITIYSKPKVKHIKLNKEDIEKIKQQPLGNELIKFRKKLYKIFKSENLNLLNNNIKTLKIKFKYIAPEILSLKVTDGEYKFKSNKIKIMKHFKAGTTNHEFFHMSTSFYHKEAKLAFSGFQQINYLKEETVGYGLNEGYTELLANRYFNEETKYNNYSYNICKFFSSKLEEIVEKDRMEKFYISADLFGLYNYLMNFEDGGHIVTFIACLDCLVKHASSYNSKKYETHYELLECYLAKWYINKKKKELEQNIIDKNTYDIEIKNYIDSLGNKDLYLKNYVKQKEYCLK